MNKDIPIKWEDFNPNWSQSYSYAYEDTNIICPKCGKLIKRYVGSVLTSCPPKYRYDCLSCGWTGTK